MNAIEKELNILNDNDIFEALPFEKQATESSH